ncbi:MAG TPA: thioredoxin family protein [Bacteroidales bacterium]|jgi:thioredoxin-related protein|nr:thioredoxin family protein [Bacteroidales bacterium]
MIKKILLLLFFPYISYSQGISFFEGSFESLKKEAAKQNKFIFIDCYTTWCGPCKWLAKNVFTNKEVGNFYNQNFINYSLDMEKGEGKDLQKQFGISAYPTLLFIDSKGNIQHRYVGACDTSTFIGVGKQALDTINNFGSLLRKYQNGNREPEFLAKYAMVCASVYYPYNIEEYFKTQNDTQLFSEINVRLMETYRPSVLSREFKYVMQNIERFIELYGFEKIYNLTASTMSRTLYTMSNQKQFDASKQIDEYINPLEVAAKNYWKNAFLLDYYGFYKVKKYPEYIQQSNLFLNSAKTDNPAFLGKSITIVVNFVSEHINDTKLLNEFTKIILPYSTLFSLNSNLKMAKIYIYLNQKEKALELLNKSEKLAQKNDQTKKEFDELMKKLNDLK